ncbi:MAG: EthD domain-containing protein [Porticoccaceae bacterium]|nr:EthD domain-containing protein [Porticoccaceae bacterium]
MIKLMTLFKTPAGVAPERFREHLATVFFPAFKAIPAVAAHLRKAVHHHALDLEIRHEEGIEEEGIENARWAGVGCYYIDSRVAAEKILAASDYQRLLSGHPGVVSETLNLLVDEVWIHNRDRSPLPVKAFAFFKRLPHLSRLAALQYYQDVHAPYGDSEAINRGRTVRYIQNHVLLDHHHPDPRYDFDGGPEIWFRSLDIALDLFGDQQAMATLAEDEARFVIRDDLIHFLTDEVPVFDAGP